MLQAVSLLSPEGIPMKRFSLSRPGAGACRVRFIPRLEILEDRLPPGDVLWGALLGWGAVAASDDPPLAVDACDGLSNQAKPLADLGGTDGLAVLAEANPAAEPASAIAPNAVPSTGTQQSLPDPACAQGAPASRLGAEGQANAALNASVFVTAPPGPGNPAPAFAAIAGAVAQHPPSALAASASRPSTGAATLDRTQVMNSLDHTGLSFEPNVGQTASRVDFLARTGGATVFLTPTAAVFAIQKPPPGPPSVDPSTVAGMPSPKLTTPSSDGGAAVYMQIVGANPSARPVGLQELPGKVNYFKGNDPAKWHTDIPTFGRVEYRHIYPGVSLAYYGGSSGLEYDFTVSPGADAHAIALKFDGADGVALDPQGDLVVHTAAGDLVQHAPVLYQETGDQRQPVSGWFVLDSGLVRFDVGEYDHSRPLVIDPLVLGYSTFLGGSGEDDGNAIAVDGAGDAYVTGLTDSTNFPTTPGAFETAPNPNLPDAFVTKLNAAGSALVYSTYLGGNFHDIAYGIAVDAAGSAYVTGLTDSTNFPTTPGAFDTTFNGTSDCFVAKLNVAGSALVYGTYLGGSNYDVGNGIAVDGAGDAYVAGNTGSANFPTTPGAFDATYNGGKYGGDAFATKLSADGSALLYGTYLGGAKDDYGYAIAVDGAGSAYVTGATNSADFPSTPGAFQTAPDGGHNDAYVAKLNAAGSALAYGTFLGGILDDYGFGVAVDGAGSAYVTGQTFSFDFPTTPGAFDTSELQGGAFVARLNSAGSALVYATYLGSGDTNGLAVRADGAGNAYVTGYTKSLTFPTTLGAFQTTMHGPSDAFLTKFNPSGDALVYSTYLGGASNEDPSEMGVAVDAAGSAYVTGWTASGNFPTTPGAFDATYNGGGDAFVTKFRAGLGRVPAVPHTVVP
jgi:hypothetical protein